MKVREIFRNSKVIVSSVRTNSVDNHPITNYWIDSLSGFPLASFVDRKEAIKFSKEYQNANQTQFSMDNSVP